MAALCRERLEVAGHQNEITCEESSEKHDEERRQNSARASIVKFNDGKTVLFDLRIDLTRDQITADDEENIDAGEAALQLRPWRERAA